MIQIWVMIINMKAIFNLMPLFFVMLISCSDMKDAPMDKVSKNFIATYNLPNLDGEYVNSNDFLGSYILVNFWATWCTPCVKELPSLNNLYNIFKDKKNFNMIAINIGQNKEVIEKFFIEKSSKIDFTVLLDENMELSDWNVQAIPTTFLVNDKGRVIYKIEGEKEWDSSEFTSFINSIIK